MVYQLNKYLSCPSTRMGLALNNPQRLLCYQTKNKQTIVYGDKYININFVIHI